MQAQSARSRGKDLFERFKTVFSIDLRSLALFRIGLGLILLLDLAVKSFDLKDFYTDQGILPRNAWLEVSNQWHWSLHAMSGQTPLIVVLFLLAALAALALVVGFHARLATIICWVLTVSLTNRNVYILQGGDNLLCVLCFWSMFLPVGKRWSVDAYRRSKRALSTSTSTVQVQQVFNIATIAVILQVLYLYFFTALLKTGAPWRETFDAAFYAISLQHFVTPIGSFFLDYQGFLKFGTAFVMVTELLAPLLVLSLYYQLPLRLIGVALLYSLHICFMLMLHIGLFPLIDFVALTLLLPSAMWGFFGRLFGFFGSMAVLSRIAIWGKNLYSRSIKRGVSATEAVSSLPNDQSSLTVAKPDPRWRTGVAGTGAILLPVLIQLIAAYYLYVVTYTNIVGLQSNNWTAPVHVNIAKSVARVDQRWDMFAPFPLTYSIYPQIEGTLRDGTKVNLLNGTTSESTDELPEFMYNAYPGYRWRKYLGRVHSYSSNTIRNQYGSYLCRHWNQPDRPYLQQLGTADLKFIRLHTNTERVEKERETRQVWQHWCYPEFKPDGKNES